MQADSKQLQVSLWCQFYQRQKPKINRFKFEDKINTTVAALQDAVNALIMLQLNSIKTNVRRTQLNLTR